MDLGMRKGMMGILMLLLAGDALPQTHLRKYFVGFQDKDTAAFNPFTFFDPQAIERRLQVGFPLYCYEDIPVKEEYVRRVLQICDSYTVVSRWLNGIFVVANDDQVKKISNLSFVRRVIPVGSINTRVGEVAKKELRRKKNKDYLRALISLQHRIWHTAELQRRGLTGRGIKIAVLDDGFKNANKIKALEHLFKEGRIEKTWDFWRKKEEVWDVGGHGTSVLACIAGRWDTIPLGMAQEATFLLARTEHDFWEEFPEEEYWLAGVEWADQHGARIINSSLGYVQHRYFPEEVDGKKGLVTWAALQAARRGILVVNSAGNDGNKRFKFIGKPADADSILAVGGIDPLSGIHIRFSSYGPSADGRLKPEICGPGRAVSVEHDDGSITEIFGTSFAAPFITGIAACLWQNFPNYNNMQIRDILMKGGYLYPYFDYAHGYGPPEVRKILNSVTKTPSPTFDIKISDTQIVILPYHGRGERLLPQDDYLFWKIEDERGFILRYGVVKVVCDCPIHLPQKIKKRYPAATRLHVFYRRYIFTGDIK